MCRNQITFQRLTGKPKPARHKLAENTMENCTNVTICRLPLVALPIFIQSTFFFSFLLPVSAPYSTATLVHSSPMKSRKGPLMTYFILLSYIPALFRTSLIQTTGPKMAALTFVFSLLLKVVFCCFVLFLNENIKDH